MDLIFLDEVEDPDNLKSNMFVLFNWSLLL